MGLPAFFSEYGEHLLYLNDELYDLHGLGDATRPGPGAPPLPRQILENGVGIEYGWRHTTGCGCPVCNARATPGDARKGVA